MRTPAFDLALFVPTSTPAVGDGVQVTAVAPFLTAWAPTGGGGSSLVDAPSDGVPYARQNAAWVPALTPDSIIDMGTY